MAKLGFSALSVVLVAALQAGCASTHGRGDYRYTHLEAPRASCDTSIRYIDLDARLRNVTSRSIRFHLDGDRGPPFDPWYLGYRVYSAAPGEPFKLVHNSGHDSEWTRTVAIAPGSSADFNTPIFGLRPADYLSYFRIELRDANRRSYWTPAFELCAVIRASCECPQPAASTVSPRARRAACPAAALASVATNATQLEIGARCR